MVVFGLHVTVPVYCAVWVMVVTGVCVATGTVTPCIALILMTVGAAVAGKATVNTNVAPLLLTQLVGGLPLIVNPCICDRFAKPPLKVYPEDAVSVIVAVYTVLYPNVAGLPFHDNAAVNPVPLLMAVEGVAPTTGEVTPERGAAVIKTGDTVKDTLKVFEGVILALETVTVAL